MADIEILYTEMNKHLAPFLKNTVVARGELTIEIRPEDLHVVCLLLRDTPTLQFQQLIDICGVDYLHYGLAEWETDSATATGFERGVEANALSKGQTKTPRFAVVYHLLSLAHNHRIRIRVWLDDAQPKVSSVTDIWPAANWFEREAFDLFGIEFSHHPDLRRLLTDYGFIGHPFRKDFPLSGHVEVRYDAKLRRVIYEPVSIVPRVLEPKVIRRDNRYEVGE